MKTEYRGSCAKNTWHNPPEGMTSEDIRHYERGCTCWIWIISLNDDELDDDFGEEGFYIF